tara:strand:- start:393 stop:566 length:174 start_codon:yes stop_codon:yes gene_type:complete
MKFKEFEISICLWSKLEKLLTKLNYVKIKGKFEKKKDNRVMSRSATYFLNRTSKFGL